MDGIVNFMKPAGITSHDAVYIFRKLTGIKKIGHTGTLDPMAQGVLPICIGKTTRLIEYLEGDKRYTATMKLGLDSETQDIWGSDIKETNVPKIPTQNQVEECMKSFEGPLIQRVPGFSAQKHKGKKLYEYAREGKEIPVKEKEVYIKNITVIEYSPEAKEIVFDISCSKGTYVRTICAETGKKLNTTAVMSSLTRTEANGLTIAESVTVENLEDEKKKAGNINKYIKNSGTILPLPNIILNEKNGIKFENGIKIRFDDTLNINNDVVNNNGQAYAVFVKDNGENNRLIGIGISLDTEKGIMLKPQKVFHNDIN